VSTSTSPNQSVAADQDMPGALCVLWGSGATSPPTIDDPLQRRAADLMEPLQWPPHLFDLVDLADSLAAPFCRWGLSEVA
jgi:hypothetical protein